MLSLQIVELLNIVYCLAELTEFAAFIALRIRAPDLKRPYRIPLPTWGCVIMLLPASVLLLVILALPIIQGDWQVGLHEPLLTLFPPLCRHIKAPLKDFVP